MPAIDPTTSIGKLRLRCGDFSDLPLMPDEVYQSAIDDTTSLPQAAKLMAQYILATLTCQTHQKLAQIEVFGNQYFEQYLSFVKATFLNPNLMETAPIPYAAGTDCLPPLLQFQKDWNENYARGTQSQLMHDMAIGGPPGFWPGHF